MNFKKIFILSLIISSSFAGCKNKERESHLYQINALSIRLDSLENVIETIDNQNTKERILEINNTLSSIKSKIDNDTLSYDFIEKLNQYKDLPSIFSTNSENLDKVKHSLPEVKKKLSDLKHDIEYGVNDRKQYDEFITFEKNKVIEIENVLNYYLQIDSKYQFLYDSLHPIMVKF